MIITGRHYLARYIIPIKDWKRVRNCYSVNTETMAGECHGFGLLSHFIKVDRLVTRDDLPNYFQRGLRELGVEIVNAHVLEELPYLD